MIATLIDYGAGNVTSVARALRRLGADVRITDQPEELTEAACLILPGVGHCAALLHSLDAHGLRQPLLTAISRGTPFLGICLGLQALYQSSAEAPELNTLTAAKSVLHSFKDGFYRLFGFRSSNIRFLYDGIDDVELDHTCLPLTANLC